MTGKASILPRERLLLDQHWRFHLGDIPFPEPVTHEENYLRGLSKSGGFQGVAVPDGLHEFRIRRLQEAGSNAWRCAHNPPARSGGLKGASLDIVSN